MEIGESLLTSTYAWRMCKNCSRWVVRLRNCAGEVKLRNYFGDEVAEHPRTTTGNDKARVVGSF